MSVNLHLGVVVRDHRPERAAAIERAIRAVLEGEEIDGDLPPLADAVDAEGRCLVSRTDPASPVIISRAYEWAPRVEEALRAAAAEANGGPCRVAFEWEDADEARDAADGSED